MLLAWGKSQCLRNREGVREIKWPEVPVEGFFVERGTEKERNKGVPRAMRWEQGDGNLWAKRSISQWKADLRRRPWGSGITGGGAQERNTYRLTRGKMPFPKVVEVTSWGALFVCKTLRLVSPQAMGSVSPGSPSSLWCEVFCTSRKELTYLFINIWDSTEGEWFDVSQETGLLKVMGKKIDLLLIHINDLIRAF